MGLLAIGASKDSLVDRLCAGAKVPVERCFPWMFFAMLAVATMPQPISGAAQALPGDHLIVPGARIGPAEIAPADQGALQRALGEPNRSERRGDHDYYVYGAGDDPDELAVDFDLVADSPFEISTTSPAYRTQDGLGVGVSEKSVLTKLGAPICEGHNERGDGLLVYASIWFQTAKGHVAKIAIRGHLRPSDFQSGPLHC